MRTAIAATLYLCIAALLFGQAVSKKQDIAVFRLSHYNWNVPPDALGQVDQRIEGVFINIGRFTVIGMNYRLSEGDITDFITRLQELKTSQANVPKQFSLGKEAFTEADLNRLIGSFVIVVPVLTSYSLSYEQSTGYTAELQTSFTFISGENMNAIAHFTIGTVGIGPTAAAAAGEAANRIPQQLVYQIRTIPQFQIKTGIIEVNGSTVLLQLGKDMGVRPGDEYAIVTSRALPSGYTVSDQTGLIIIKRVEEKVSYGHVVYSKDRPSVGEQLKEIPRVGFESSFYLHTVIASEPVSRVFAPVVTLGSLHVLTRGFYNFRPLVGFEVPLAGSSIGGSGSYTAGGLPLNLYLGGELNWRFWRFDLVPLAAVGIGGAVPLSSQQVFELTLGGGLVQLSLSYLINPQVKLAADLGYEQWLPFSLAGWGGVYGGVGVAINY